MRVRLPPGCLSVYSSQLIAIKKAGPTKDPHRFFRKLKLSRRSAQCTGARLLKASITASFL